MMRTYFLVLATVSVIAFFAPGAFSSECEVCEKFLGDLVKRMEAEKIEGEANIKAALREDCKKAKGKDNRFCYYIGGTDDAATTMVNDVAKPLSNHIPVSNVCKKLKKKDSQICELKYEKALDWSKVNLKKMRVKELKKILNNWGEECRGCIEKGDFIKRINELKPKYVKEEL